MKRTVEGKQSEKLGILLCPNGNEISRKELETLLRGALSALKASESSREFRNLTGKVVYSTPGECRDDAAAFIAVGSPGTLSSLKEATRPMPVIVLSAKPVVDPAQMETLLMPSLTVDAWIRWDRLNRNPLDPEEYARLLEALKARIRKTMRNSLREEELSKDIAWKVQIEEKALAEPGYLSFFSDPATREMVESLKTALLGVKGRFEKLGELMKKNDFKPASGPFVFEEAAKKAEALRKDCGENGTRLRPPSILLLGETGTGKTLLARYISEQLAGRETSLSQLNIGAISKDFMYGELFGGTKGAWTGLDEDYPGFLLSNAGKPVFLDEIGDMEERCQVQLLTLLDKGEVQPLKWRHAPLPCPVAIIAASNRPLKAWAAEGSERFRSDLFHRFDYVIEVPPLRERKADLRLLISTTLQDPEVNPRLGEKSFQAERISLDAIEHLEKLEFPGNFRELRYRLSRAVAEAGREGSGTICLRHLDRLG
jgi:transcriptional regulator of acetoin/glycerol metabolism